jgi:hypothetical protein
VLLHYIFLLILWPIDELLSGDYVITGCLIGNTCNNRKTMLSVVCVMVVCGQWLGKHVSTATDTNTTIDEMFSMWSVLRCYKQVTKLVESETRVEVGLNTCIVTLRVVGGDEKGSLKSETVKYGRKSQGTRT